MSTLIGVLGAGQLGRMLALAGLPMGLGFRFFDSNPEATAGQLAPLVVGRFDDADALTGFARGVDVVTYDWENVPVTSVREVARHARALPSARALAAAQDRLTEKRLLARVGMRVAPHARVDSLAQLRAAAAEVGLPGLLKTRRLGYDGKGQVVIRREAELEPALASLGGRNLVYEGMIPFEREVSLVAVRSRRGETRFYPLTENRHREGILRESRAPWQDPGLQRAAERQVGQLLEHLRYVGVLCVEFFVHDGRLVANEFAPRVHNSGHWTIEGARTSQFENHLRAILGWPLGDTAAVGHALMVNCIGSMPRPDLTLTLPGVHHHDYHKAPREGRKVGHLNWVADSPARREAIARKLADYVAS
ncbi:MAG: 5-(carboxyamino)imidazole ribonucleotide synthase [Steroidobacteraceae bacterium]